MPKPMRHFTPEQLQRAIEFMRDRVYRWHDEALSSPPYFQGEEAQRLADQEFDYLLRTDPGDPDYIEGFFPCYSWVVSAFFDFVRDINIHNLQKETRQCQR